MKKPILLLSVDSLDREFCEMKEALDPVADVRVSGVSGYNLSGVEIFIGKKMSLEELSSADSLKVVFAYKTGVDDFPLEVLKERGVTVCNSHINSRIIAQYAFILAASLTSRVAEYDYLMRRGDWSQTDPCWRSVFDMKIGLVGYGAIGREIGKILQNNGIAGYTLNRGKQYDGITPVDTLEELCEISDLLILSLPKTPETDCMFDEKIFSLLNGKFIVNVGRENCIDEAAFYHALKNGLGGAAIDTWESKPKKGQVPFYPYTDKTLFHKLPNILMSSHKAMQLKEGHGRYVKDVTENVLGYLSGKELKNVVDLTRGY